LLISAASLDAQGQAGPDAVARELRALNEQMRASGSVRAGAATVARSDVVLDSYERRAYGALWSEEAVRQLIRAVEGLREDGLEPTHYHLVALQTLAASPPSPASAARLDLLASDALVRVARDLRFGRVEPTGPTTAREETSPFGGADAAADLERVATGGRVVEAVRALRPTHFVYQGLVRALAQLRGLQTSGGWAAVPSGKSMRLDSADARVPQLRERLRVSGDLTGEAGAGTRFDAELEAAVKRFQHRHGLNEDGIVGAATLAELNVPVERRIDQLRINLERARWVTHGLPETFVAVNVAGAKVYLLRDGDVALESRVIVGREYTRTPVFTAPMRYIDLNPTWTVPPGIVGEVLARVRREPGYLAEEGMRILDGGREVDPAGVDFSRYDARTFPYTFRQDPGPANPLGRIKLVFPNEHNVYLHDTPSRSLFEREERLFSHGCIRVENPVALAALILDDAERWSVEKLEAAIATGELRTIPLERPIQVLILYWTASADLHGELHFYRDVYARDAEVLAALNGR
jgi:murein L,D-transpeptidase YcbB/YkuD